jgi:hypothetical protein
LSILLLISEILSIRAKNTFKTTINLLNTIVNNDKGKTIFETYGIKKILFKNPTTLISYDIFIIIGILDKNEIKLIFVIDVLLLFSLYKRIKKVIVKDKINPV